MHVYIHALNARLGGGQTYLGNMLRYVPDKDSLKVTLLVPYSAQLPALAGNVCVRRGAEWLENPLLRMMWEKLILPRILKKEQAEVLFCPGGVVVTRPPRNCRVVTMFRNMIPFNMKQRMRYPYGYKRLRNWLLQRVMLSSMQKADLVIFISRYAREVISGHKKTAIRKSVVIPHGVNDIFRAAPAADSKPSFLPEGDYLLYVSSIDVYKMQIEVVQAFAQLDPGKRGLSLLLVGPVINSRYGARLRDEISRLGLGDVVRFIGSVPYEQLPYLYQNATINIFASECENCPNILLEMMASRRPVVCSSYPPMPEFGDDAVSYFEPEQPETLSRLLEELLDDSSLREDLAEKALKRAEGYRWEKAAGRTWREIISLGERRQST